MKHIEIYRSLACCAFLLCIGTAKAQTGGGVLSVGFPASVDTTGMDAIAIRSLERKVKLSLPFSGASTDTLVVQLGLAAGSYDLLTRRFPLNATGQFDDGCSLSIGGNGMTVGLGRYTGLSSFYVRAWLASAGMGSAVTAH